MRVADNMSVRSFLSNLEEVSSRLFRRNLEVSSGKKLLNPSADPIGSARVLKIRDSMSRINQYFRNINYSRTYLSGTSDALNSLQNLIHSVSQKAVQGLNGVLSQPARNAVAAEIDELAHSMLNISETTIDGKRIFSGTQVAVNPLSLNGAEYVYQGDDQALMVEISEQSEVQINVPGSEVFTEASSDLINTVRQLANRLRGGDLEGAEALLGKLNASSERIDVARIRVGQHLNRLDDTKADLDGRLLNLTQELSGIEDADMAESISAMTQSETALRATLAAGARIQQYNLFDIIG